MNVFNVMGVARSGVGFMCRAWFDEDGSLTLVSNDAPGWRSAHRQVAESRGLAGRTDDRIYTSSDGVAMRRTRWIRDELSIASCDDDQDGE